MEQKIQDFLAFLTKVKGVAENTVLSYRRDLYQMNDFFKQNGIDMADKITSTNVNSYVLHMEKNGKSPSSVSRNISCMRSFFRYLINRGEISKDPTELVSMPKYERKQPEIVSLNTMESLLKAPSDNTAKGIRDKAMLQLLYVTGMRVSELINLKLEDVNLEMKYVILKNSKKNRVVPFDTRSKNILKKYLSDSREELASKECSIFFVNCSGKEMTRQGFWKIIKGYAKELGINEDISPHTFRHSFGVHLLENGANIRDIQKIMGHVDISSTNVYAKITEEKLKNIHNRII